MNFTQLGMAVHGAQLAGSMINPTTNHTVAPLPNSVSPVTVKTVSATPSRLRFLDLSDDNEDNFPTPRGDNAIGKFDILTIFNLVDIQFAPLKFAGDADKRLALIDQIFTDNPHLSICTGIPDNQYFPSKTVVDFAYHQFNNYTKSKGSRVFSGSG